MENLCNESIFIRRSGEYKGFKEHVFIIELHNKALLEERDYVELFEYMGIDVVSITDDVTFIIANPAEGKGDDLSTLGEVGAVKETIR